MGLVMSRGDFGWDVVFECFVEPLGVPPVDPVYGRELDLCYSCPGRGVEQLSLI